MRLISALLLSCLLGATPVLASGGGHGEKKSKEESAEIGAPRAPSVSMPKLVAPVIIDGELHRYAYLGITLLLEEGADRNKMLERIPYIQDAFLRDVHSGTTIARNGDPSLLDLEALAARLTRICATIVGPNIVKNIEIHDADDDLK